MRRRRGNGHRGPQPSQTQQEQAQTQLQVPSLTPDIRDARATCPMQMHDSDPLTSTGGAVSPLPPPTFRLFDLVWSHAPNGLGAPLSLI
ncbi:hypothetical protein GLA29479_138 [Lysobacter antibioticus]|nr:hypothetical protein GLA29479_138 [Lysobacter antibioticus]